LHLTDLHFGWESTDPSKKAERQLVLDGLVDRVAALPKEWRPKIVCVSGDIAWKGKAPEYALAKEWMTRLLDRLELTFGDVVVCAGNHDTDRDVTGRIARPKDAKEADEILRAPIASHTLSAFKAFTEFCKDAGVKPYLFQGDSSYVVGHMLLHGVRFVACNSAWFCKGEDDKGNLWVGLPLIRIMESEGGLKSRSTTSEPTVCLIHHPPHWWNEAETNASPGRPNTRDYLAHRADVILSGHTHGEVRKADRIAQGALHLTGGAGYSGSDHYNSYRLVRVGKKALESWSFEYDPRSAECVWRDHGVNRIPFGEGPLDAGRVAHNDNTLSTDLNRLDALSSGPMEDVSTAVHGLPALDRVKLTEKIQNRLSEEGICLAAGESGSGKSAVAKTIGGKRYERVFWLTADSLDAPNSEGLREKLGLKHPLAHVLTSVLGTCLVVIDGAERCTGEALREVARLIKEVRGHEDGRKVHFLVTFQLEAARRVVSRLQERGLSKAEADLIEVDRPSEEEVATLLRPVATLSWAALRPEFRELLTNLKLLDWVVRAAESGLEFAHGQPVTLTGLVDRLWERWIEQEGLQFGRSGLLLKLGELEAQTLSDGVPKRAFEYTEQSALVELVGADLVRVRNERVRFAHDLIGDWSRLRFLVGEDPTASKTDRERAAAPRWQRAVRLYGQRLLEQGGSGPNEWMRAVARADDGSDAGRLVGDLLLESLFFARSARSLLEQAWPLLTADKGKLLRRLLGRFMFVATVPDDRLYEYFKTSEEVDRFEYLYRVPFGPYWGPVLAALFDHRDEVASLCPSEGALVARLWLRSTPPMAGKSQPFWWRREAAELALTISSRYRRLLESRDLISDDGDQPAYEAVLLATPDLPDEVSAFCLELAKRIPRASADESSLKDANEEVIREIAKENPDRAQLIRRMRPPFFPQGPLQAPWPDGPFARVDESFQRACLDSGAFPSFFSVNAEVAVEVLLAVTIKEPQQDNPFGYSDEDLGVETWQAAYPPLYFRGPFLAMLRENSQAALTYVVKLVNFATRRFTETDRRLGVGPPGDHPVTEVWIEVGGTRRRWLGDHRVYRWAHDWPLNAKPVICSLMALEFWLYEEMGKGNDVSAILERVLWESESLAFAGLLIDVGKKHNELLAGPLRPLMSSSHLFQLDRQACDERQGVSVGLMPWAFRQSAVFVALARDWYGQPHRKVYLLNVVQRLLLTAPQVTELFVGVRSAWRAQMRGDAKHPLRYLIEQLNPDNFVAQRINDREDMITIRLPEELRKETAEGEQQIEEELLVIMTPVQCRQRLDNNNPVPSSGLDTFWNNLQRLDTLRSKVWADEFGSVDPINGVVGGVAVLTAFHLDWLTADPVRLAWCRAKLDEICRDPPKRSPFDIEEAPGGHHWDTFAADAGAALWAVNPGDLLARQLVANGVTAIRYATAGLTIKRSLAAREKLGDDFLRLVSLGLRFSAIRCVIFRGAQVQVATEDWEKRAEDLYTHFIKGSLPAKLPSLAELSGAASEGLAAIQKACEQRMTEQTPPCRESDRGEKAIAAVTKVRRRPPTLDTHLLEAVLTPLAVSALASSGARDEWRTLLDQLLALTLEGISGPPDRGDYEIDGLPTDFDQWVLERVAILLPLLPINESRELWRPILDLGVPGHQWVEQFFWHWFTDGHSNTPTPLAFTRVWEQMLRYALEHSGWSVGRNTDVLSKLLTELLGHHFGMRTVANDTAYVDPLGKMEPVFSAVAGKWFVTASVVGGFARFAVAPAAANLLLPSIHWLNKAIETVRPTKTERHLAESLINLLRVTWGRHRAAIDQDSGLMEAFQAMLNRLSSEGDHAALALREQVLESLSGRA